MAHWRTLAAGVVVACAVAWLLQSKSRSWANHAAFSKVKKWLPPAIVLAALLIAGLQAYCDEHKAFINQQARNDEAASAKAAADAQAAEAHARLTAKLKSDTAKAEKPVADTRPARHLTDEEKQNLQIVFAPLANDFDGIKIAAATDPEAQALEKEYIDALSEAGIRMIRADYIAPAGIQPTGILVAINDPAATPPLAEKLASGLATAGIAIKPSVAPMDSGDFILIIGYRP